jgi:hypothetical protein
MRGRTRRAQHGCDKNGAGDEDDSDQAGHKDFPFDAVDLDTHET